MVELGLTGAKGAKMLHNDSHKFESEFISLTIPQNNSVMFGSLSGNKLGLWVAERLQCHCQVQLSRLSR